MNILTTTSTALLLAGCSALVGCSGDKGDNSVTYDVTADVAADAPTTKTQPKTAAAKSKSRLGGKEADKDSEPYKLGREHGKKLHERCRTEEEVRDEVLDINARITNIQCRIGENAANDYMTGMRDYLTETGDTLATTLF